MKDKGTIILNVARTKTWDSNSLLGGRREGAMTQARKHNCDRGNEEGEAPVGLQREL